MNNSKRPFSLSFYIYGMFLCVFSTFFLGGASAAYEEQLSSETLKDWSQDIPASFFILFLSAENHYYYQEEEPETSLASLFIKLITNIQPSDTRTFLGRELPGFAIFDTDIVIAGEGTDFTTLPIESAPPMDVLLKEREIASEMLEDEDPAPGPAPDKQPVLVYHTHSWESFLPLLKGVTDWDEAISSNELVNVVAVGKKLTNELQARGVGVQHDTTDMTKSLKNRGLNYNHSYQVSREIVEEALAGNKELHFLIDIHRDGQGKETTTKVINDTPYARLFFVVGKEHRNYEQNLKVATKLNERLEAKYPGISRGVIMKGKNEGNGIYNQDLSERALLIEFGGVENDITELNNTVKAFAEVFSEYYWQAEMVNN